MRKIYFLFTLSLIVGVITTASGIEREKPPRNIVLIGWDGAGRNHIKELIGRGELPNLKKLSSEGALVAIDVLRVTDTKAGWTQILTGYEPEVTGVFSNYRYGPIPRGYTIFERLKNFFGTENFAAVAVIGKGGNVGADPPRYEQLQKMEKQSKEWEETEIEKEVVVIAGVKYLLIPAEPYYYTQENMNAFVNGLGKDDKVGTKTLELLDKYKDKPFFFFVHFAEVDENGHRYGERSKEYDDALISADTWAGRITQKLMELGLYDKTLIYVTADHGFDIGRKRHDNAPYVFLATNDPKVFRRGTRVDIAPTILDRFGLDLSKINPPLDGHPLTKPYTAPLW